MSIIFWTFAPLYVHMTNFTLIEKLGLLLLTLEKKMRMFLRNER
jgi:hypothetical protein